ncbi:MAG: HAMP domain-containing histidine kinase [Ruminococcaceae bacterium]|nr:HAMP domain-containing histidine kinase [Oscillospiraceae bacterium]
MKKMGGLRRRWIMNTVGVDCILGLICVLAVTMVFAAYYYSAAEADLHSRADNIVDFFANSTSQNYKEFYQACINYANTFEDKNVLELQFISQSGDIVATSHGDWAMDPPATPEIMEAISTLEIKPYRGKDPSTGERIIAVSSPMVYKNGEVIGVLRFVTSTRLIDRQIMMVAGWAMLALATIAMVVLFSSNYYIKSILVPVDEIIEKAKRIAGGTYGIQISSPYDDEIGELADTINDLSMQLNQNEKMQREFISSLSHELRTPLTSITGWSETLLADESLDADTRRGMSIIYKEGKRLTEMVVELLDFNRMQDGRATLNIELADIRGEFEDTVYMYSSRLTQENIHLHYYDNDEDIPEIPCDLKRLRQVFLNILDNAAKHGGEGGKIDASIHLEDPDVVIRIRDYGPGIPEDEIPLVKRKFYKGSSKARGTGIGLAVCDEIVQLHNGELTLENAEGGGTLVTIRLPISQ